MESRHIVALNTKSPDRSQIPTRSERARPCRDRFGALALFLFVVAGLFTQKRSRRATLSSYVVAPELSCFSKRRSRVIGLAQRGKRRV